MKKIAIVLSLLLSCATLFATWDPDLLEEDLDVLDDPVYQIQKERVVKYLANSWCSAEKANLLMDLVAVVQPEVCVEIGAFTGSSVLPVAAALQYLDQGRVFAIDAWSNSEAVRYLDNDDPNRPWWAIVNMNEAYNSLHTTLKLFSLGKYCMVIRLPSDQAIDRLDRIDFLHLDGDYSKHVSVQDVMLYLPKVVSGGYILLSNIYISVNGKQPKIASYAALLDQCERICEIEQNNAVLFRKK